MDAATINRRESAVAHPAEPKRPGRKRDAAKDAQIVAAARELIGARAFEAVTMDDVAEHAGVGKATVYRRWSSKVHLAVDAMLEGSPALTVDSIPDSGSLRGDLMTLPAQIARAHDDATTDLLRPAREHPEVAELLHQRLVRDRVAVLEGLLERAQDRGEVPADRDIALIASVGPAMVFYGRAFSNQPFTPEYMERVIDGVLLPLALGYPER